MQTMVQYSRVVELNQNLAQRIFGLYVLILYIIYYIFSPTDFGISEHRLTTIVSQLFCIFSFWSACDSAASRAMDQLTPQLPESDLFRTVLYYVLLILVVPVFAFFASKTVLFELILRMEPSSATLYSAIVAVITVHVSLGMYVARAFREPKDGKRD